MSDQKPEDLQADLQAREPSATLYHQWIAAGIVSAAARFIPIPLVDDVVRGQCRRFVVSRTLAYHDAGVSLDDLKPYYGGTGGCLTGCLGTVAKLPLKLLLFPIRKVMAVVTSVRGVPLEILRLVLLGRTLDRYLREKPAFTGAGAKSGVSARMRTAFDEAFTRIDFHVVHALISDALSGVSGWRTAATTTARNVATGDAGQKDDLQADPEVEAGATRVQAVLGRPETLAVFVEFDKRFDEAFDRLAVG